MSIRKMVRAAVIAAVYVCLCLVLAPFSFGPVQIRFAEALTLLPIICPEAILGVTLGCFLSNLIASAPVDMVVGTAATLAAAWLSYKLRRYRVKGLPLWAALPPVLINAVVVGIELTILYFSPASPLGVYVFNMLSVGVGQLVSCGVLGVLLVWCIERSPALYRIFGGEDTPPLPGHKNG